MKSINVNLKTNNYDIIIEKDILKSVGNEIYKVHSNKKISVITDSNVFGLYGKILSKSLRAGGYSHDFIILNPGEKSKSLDSLKYVYDNFIKYGITRGDLIIAFGGGVIGDLAGFAASTYLRGIDYIQIPTSLLAQVDSSFGGKVAVNLEQGKNLIGNFYHPKKVIIDPNLLKSLPEDFIKDGMGEVIKYACISDIDFYSKLISIKTREELFENMEDIIYTSCNIKSKIVEKDAKDTSLRMVLNFGHTLGHALEKIFNYERYTHGEAVSIGMYNITLMSEILGYTKLGTADKIKQILTNFDIDYNMPEVNMEDIKKIILLDKKNISGTINLILLKNIGNVYIEKISTDNLDNFFSQP